MKPIYAFYSEDDVEAVSGLGPDTARGLVGGKGAGLFEMARLRLPVPPGFTLTTEVCRGDYNGSGRRRGRRGPPGELSLELRALDAALAGLERAAGRRFGDPISPLLVSVRSGAKFSMPGMMDTVLNLGLNDRTVRGLAEQTANPRFAWDCYRRFIAMFGNVVCGLDKELFEAALRLSKAKAGVREDAALSAADLESLCAASQGLYREAAGEPFPQEPRVQLRRAVEAVFRSWGNARATAYRRLHHIPDDLGTACTVQAMVFGNMGPDSATGVGFTRDPRTGEKRFFGEFLANAQGEDVVAGTRTPRPLSELEEAMPAAFAQLTRTASALERHFRDMQDLEFTIERGRLYMLQTRTAKRTAIAALKVAVDMVEEGLITPAAAVRRVTPAQLDELLRPVFDPAALRQARILAAGLAAGPGAATGRIALSADRAQEQAAEGPVILVRPETNPDDIHGMAAAEGILTATGGLTSHAAVVGRGLGKVCVVGCGEIEIDEREGTVHARGAVLREGDFVSLDGFCGHVLEGRVATRPPQVLEALLGRRAAGKEPARGADGQLLDAVGDPAAAPLYAVYQKFMGWVDNYSALAVRANADTPADARVALALGATGIGLCRTEHMFFAADRIPKVLAMILAEDEAERRRALDALFPLQKDDFVAIFRAMHGRPVTIRTIDPPLHEFLPRSREDARRVSAELGLDAEKVWAKAEALREQNPMLGHRGCRVGITYPEITEMQARAILAAACEVAREGLRVQPEIMIPLAGHASELREQRARVARVAAGLFEEHGLCVPYKVGAMIEVPRAALTAREMAAEAEFFSFGTNDLTQMTLGFSRDDYGRFVGRYLEQNILAADPFATLDVEGVGRLVRLATAEGRAGRAGLKVGICGEHGGDPASIRFFNEAGLDYVSCSPYRVPVARLACAQAALEAAAPARQGQAASTSV